MRETATSTELRRQALAQAYVATKGNVREAAEMAGYAYSSALQVLREPEFESRYLDPARRAILAPGLQAAQITAQRVMLELGRAATCGCSCRRHSRCMCWPSTCRAFASSTPR